MTVDVHQHLWTPAFVDALRRRTAAPRLDGWTLHTDGEPPYQVNPSDHDLAARLALNSDLALALVSLSSPLGIESLPPGEAWPIIDAYHEDALALPAPFGAWAATCLSEIDPDRLAKSLDTRGFAGLQLPATAVRDAAGLAGVAPLLDALTERDLPLFVHPGPAPEAEEPEGALVPGWWPAVVPYVQQMHAAWYAFAAFGRARHPRLRVCFSLLAGLAPLHSERLANRGGEGRGQVDPGLFLETSSYGPRAIDAIIRELGVDVVVSGSDQPYATAPDPGLGDAAWHAIAVTNPNRLLNRKESRQ
ncbi:amidohydrolase family protein [Streptosporangium amethystogenes]|uniref:amidohydrolase family protein n=1 Tax=Streptosporangium amethystogenes TaxID=2002 RepID=UPI0004C91FE5|nr:amidohydrolase family protein [Streptosporangium amethystogenes]